MADEGTMTAVRCGAFWGLCGTNDRSVVSDASRMVKI
jgi:hypothetical protein